MSEFHHITVLEHELVTNLALQAGDIAIDCTAGGGGHTKGLLEAVGVNGKVYAFDRDERAIATLNERFPEQIAAKQLVVIKTAFSHIRTIAMELGIAGKIRGICADIGVSSPQLDHAERGFSFAKSGPLDMRMDTSPEVATAADLVNSASEKELTEIFRNYGEEPKARFVARAIIETRKLKPITETSELSEIVKNAIFYNQKSRKHPATKVFQALRIAVNNELDELKTMLADGFELLGPHGRFGVISFHSLEDRIVKKSFKEFSEPKTDQRVLRNLPLTAQQLEAMSETRAKIIKPFPIVPTSDEEERNPRSRSAKLRVVEKN